MKSPLIIKSFLFGIFLLLAGISNATDYYVSSSGSNSNNGTSEATPWQTLSKVESVANAGTIRPGDRILFKCGDTFTGNVVIGSIWGHNAKSGTAASPITMATYGTGAKPTFLYPSNSSTPPDARYLFFFIGVDYWVVDGFNFTDINTNNDKVTPGNCGVPLYLGSYGDAPCNHWLIQNVDISLCGMGVVFCGDFNKATNCNMTNFKNLLSTPDIGGSSAWEDYGANAFTIFGSDNEISHCYIAGAWAESLDFGYNGGACEMYNSCSRNKLMYNTFYDCGGISEFGGSASGASSADNLFAYNKVINCGLLTWINMSGVAAMPVTNTQYFNNVIIENSASRFSGPNAGAGIVSPEALSHFGADANVFAYSGSVSGTVFNLKNNVFQLSTGIDVLRNNESRATHANNIYKLSNGSVLNVPLAATEMNTTAAIFTNTTPADPVNWNFVPAAGSPVIDFGQNVGIAKDFVGNPVPAVPNAGIMESPGTVSTLIATSSSSVIACNGGTATVTVTATGGTAPYTGTGTFTVTAGTYSYTVTDAAAATATTSVTVTQPAAISASVVAGSIATYGGTTNVNVIASGGTGAYTYKLNNGSYQTSNIFTGVSAGSYSVTVKDANGCTVVKNFTLTQPAAPSLAASSTAGSISCNGGTTTVTVTATGGVIPYSGIGTFTVGAGTYSYTVTDANNATSTTSITVSQPTAIAVTISAGTITIYGGTAAVTVNATGGTAPYTYRKNSGSYQSSNVFASLPAGTYSFTVKDANGCTSVQSFVLSQPAAPVQLAAASSAGTISCNGGNTTVTVTATGGTAPYSGTGSFTVSAGTYNYTVTDANGATATTSITVGQPAAIAIIVSSGNIVTYGGTTTVSVNASGGTGVYTYKLDNGSYQSSNSFSAVAAGNHAVTVKDANGCTSVKNFTLNQPAAPAQLVAAASAGTISCNGGTTTVTVSATGGVAPYTGTGSFTVSAGTYNYTVTDANGATASASVTVGQPTVISVTVSAGTIAVFGGTTTVTVNASGGTGAYSYKLDNGSYQSSNTFSAVAAGNHAVTVKDANGCTSAKSFTLTQPAANIFTATATATTIHCYADISTVTVRATGGTAPYTGIGLFTAYAGSYTYTVTDATGATAVATLTITQPASIVVNLTAGTIHAAGETTTVTVSATGGAGPYVYKLDDGAYQPANTFTGVAAGNYAVTVKDANGCTAVKSISVTEPSNLNFKISLLSKTNVNCRGGNSGTIEVLARGGRAPYSYQLNNGRYTSATIFRNLAAGVYRISAKDANGVVISLVAYIYDGRTECSGSLSGSRIALTAYPNPTTDRFNLSIASESEEDVVVEVMNLNGTKIFEGKGSVGKKYVFGQNFPAGTYFVRVIQGKDVKTTTLIKGK